MDYYLSQRVVGLLTQLEVTTNGVLFTIITAILGFLAIRTHVRIESIIEQHSKEIVALMKADIRQEERTLRNETDIKVLKSKAGL